MNCRYCKGVYAATDRSCGGCGAPKTAVQTLLDVPAAPDHWSHSMGRTVQRMAIASAGVALVVIAFGYLGLGDLATGIAMIWMALIAPIGLGMGAWNSSNGKIGTQVVNAVIGMLLWFGIIIALFVAIGIATAE